MEPEAGQGELFPERQHTDSLSVTINDRCRLRREGQQRVVSVCGLPLLPFSMGDRLAEAYAMVSLVEQGHARQTEVARAFGCDVRTVRRHLRRFEQGGLVALGRPSGYPRGRPRLATSRQESVGQWKGEGISNREIARRLGVDEKVVRKILRRLGWRSPEPIQQGQLPLGDLEPQEDLKVCEMVRPADPNLSAKRASRPSEPLVQRALEAGQEAPQQDGDADPNLSGFGAPDDEPLPLSLDPDPADRSVDRVLACLGMIDDAAPVFRPAAGVAGAGVLLSIPALGQSGVLDVAREIYGSIGPAFYGLRTTLITLLLMALLRIKRPEGLKEHSPERLGRLVGLDRAPEVKTLRRKLTRLAALGRGTDFGRALAEQRVRARGHVMGFLYVDGHVRAYHGQRKIPKTHVARMRLAMPATTDYWVNDAVGEPLFVVSTEANQGLVAVLPGILAEARRLVGERRVTVVFDRGGWSPQLFAKILDQGFDLLTYRKGKVRRVAQKLFSLHEATLEGQSVSYLLADTGTRLRSGLRLRQVTRLSDDGHQTHIVTSRRDLPAVEIAHRMFERWRQENFFKYLREEYALDALVDYATEPADALREVPNPARAKLDAELKKAKAELAALQSTYGQAALTNQEAVRRTMRGFKIAHSALGRQILAALHKIADLERRRATIPSRIPIQTISHTEVVKLATERKHITDLLKMVAYQAESDLVRLLEPHYRRAEDEARTLLHSAFATPGDLEVSEGQLRICLEPLSSPHRTLVLANLCRQLNETKTLFPGSRLQLQFCVKPEPPISLAFPGARPPQHATDTAQPDIFHQG